MIRAVLFDLDGTLLDTTLGVVESAVYAAQKLGYDQLPPEEMLRFVGPPIQNSFHKFYGADDEKSQQAAEIFREYYKGKALFKATPYPHMRDLLEWLTAHDISIGVATYKREDYAIDILRHFGIAEFCRSMHGADNFNRLTKADIVNLCIAELGSAKNETVLIGDTEHDANGAMLAGVGFIGVTYGFGFHNAGEVSRFPCLGAADSLLEIRRLLS